VVSPAPRLPFVAGSDLQVRTAAGIMVVSDFFAIKCLPGIWAGKLHHLPCEEADVTGNKGVV
jgi:hypothetical protein